MNITTGKLAQKEMMKGIRIATDAIRLTYGPKGMNAVIENENYPYHQVANDAQTIIQAIQMAGPLQRRGLGFLKELSDKVHKDSGDGRKTTCIIAEEILTAGYKATLSGMEIKRGLDNLIPFIEKQIDEQKQTITEKDVHKVATIASESSKIGKLIGEIYTKIGKDGIIIPEGSNTFETSYTIVEGVRFNDTGYLSPYMAHNGGKSPIAVYENPTILVTKKKIGHLNDINPLLDALNKQGKKDLVIFTDDMDSGVAKVMVKAHQDGIMNILIIKAPVLWKNYIFEDFAKVTGSTIVEDATGLDYKNLEMKHLGTCAKITTDKDETIIIPNVDFSDHTAELKKESKSGNPGDASLRLSWLQTKTAILKLGANSESELSYIRLKTEDAINASRLALRDGVVQGGGLCLNEVAMALPNDIPGKILMYALEAPLLQNLKNMDIEEPNWDEDSVLDAAAVIKNAVRNAVALASTILTCGVVVTIPAPTEVELIQMQLAAKRPY